MTHTPNRARRLVLIGSLAFLLLASPASAQLLPSLPSPPDVSVDQQAKTPLGTSQVRYADGRLCTQNHVSTGGIGVPALPVALPTPVALPAPPSLPGLPGAEAELKACASAQVPDVPLPTEKVEGTVEEAKELAQKAAGEAQETADEAQERAGNLLDTILAWFGGLF